MEPAPGHLIYFGGKSSQWLCEDIGQVGFKWLRYYLGFLF